jgi:serine phosphatase RsbU (regulator of sigma subunit)
MCSRQFDISEDGHFATVLVGAATLSTRRVVLANAGHFAPLIVAGPRCQYAAVHTAPPLGTGGRKHSTTEFVMPEGSTLLAFTDGLVERRSEVLDVGLDRLAEASIVTDASLEEYLDRIIDDLTQGESEDDIALLAFRWDRLRS